MFINHALCEIYRSDSDAFIVFAHAQRTGGRHFRDSLLRCAFGDDKIYHPRFVPTFIQLKHLTQNEASQYSVYIGHHNFILKNWTRNIFGIGLVRHPIQRLMSLQSYVKGKPNHALFSISSYDFEDFYFAGAEINPIYMSNVQCRRMSGHPEFRLAQQNLDAFLGVGVTDQLDKFVATIADSLCIKHRPIDPPEGVNAYPTDYSQYSRVVEAESHDFDLYQFIAGMGK